MQGRRWEGNDVGKGLEGWGEESRGRRGRGMGVMGGENGRTEREDEGGRYG